jgi:hypothetical protein
VLSAVTIFFGQFIFARANGVVLLMPKAEADHRWTRQRKWVLVRLALAALQIAGATASFILLAQVGVTPASLSVVVATGLCTTVSVLLFGRK